MLYVRTRTVGENSSGEADILEVGRTVVQGVEIDVSTWRIKAAHRSEKSALNRWRCGAHIHSRCT